MNGIKFVKYGAVIAAAALCVSTARVNAMTVAWGNASGATAITLNGGTVGVPDGDIVELGIFKNGISDANISLLASPAAIQAAFNVWGTGFMGDNTGSPTPVGAFGETTTSPGAGLFTSNAYMIVFNVTSVGGISGASQWGVFKGPNTGANPWLFPASDGASPPTFNADDMTAASVLIGSYGAGTYSDSTLNGGTGWYGDGANALELHSSVVPEPSTYVLVGMGLLGALRLRRRRS
jgi:hypothetical protein